METAGPSNGGQQENLIENDRNHNAQKTPGLQGDQRQATGLDQGGQRKRDKWKTPGAQGGQQANSTEMGNAGAPKEPATGLGQGGHRKRDEWKTPGP